MQSGLRTRLLAAVPVPEGVVSDVCPWCEGEEEQVDPLLWEGDNA